MRLNKTNAPPKGTRIKVLDVPPTCQYYRGTTSWYHERDGLIGQTGEIWSEQGQQTRIKFDHEVLQQNFEYLYIDALDVQLIDDPDENY